MEATTSLTQGAITNNQIKLVPGSMNSGRRR